MSKGRDNFMVYRSFLSKMQHSVIVLFVLVIYSFTSCGQIKNNVFKAVFYNVENLYDTINDPKKNDEEFLPSSSKKWGTERYEIKINNMAKVLTSIGKKELPELIGFAEIENRRVVEDLVSTGGLAKGKYKVIIEEGPDLRGIDCALAYRPDQFIVSSIKSFEVVNPDDSDFKTRNILYVKGSASNDVLHVFVNHWPSRLGGEDNSKHLRCLAAQVLRNKVDSIFAISKSSNILIMGDMNDQPSDSSILNVLNAKPNTSTHFPGALINLMYDDMRNGKGSISYRDNWQVIDNIIVSENLLSKKNGYRTSIENGFIFSEPFMDFVNKAGKSSPNRTWGGNTFYGGFSDHYPVYVTFRK